MKTTSHFRLARTIALVGLGIVTAACSSSSKPSASATSVAKGQPTVIVGSANFPENEIVATIYADGLRAKGVPVSNHFGIGSRELYYPLLQQGQISLIPEYNGSLLEFLDVQSTVTTTEAVNQGLNAILPSSLQILAPAPAEDGNALAVTAPTAARYHLTTISSLAAVASQLVVGGPPEFETRSIGLPGLAKAYGIHFKQFIPLDESGPLTSKALEDGTVQASLVFTTTPFIIQNHLVLLADAGHYYAAQNVIPLIARSAATPLVVRTLNAISAHLDTRTLTQLDDEVQNQHMDASKVAKQFLHQAGLA